jgi:predicted lactoylglutathione lyase
MVDFHGTISRKAHLAFSAGSRKQVDEFYQMALAAGGQSNGAPGLREHGPKYYAAYVLDLEGNNIEAVCNK